MESSRSSYIKFIVLGLVCIGLILTLGILWERRQQQSAIAENETTMPAGSAEAVDRSLEYYAERQQSAMVDITGTISALGNTCTIDAQCSMTVGGKTIKYGGTSNTSPVQSRPKNICYFSDGPTVGMEVEIKARSYQGGVYSIINCAECFIRQVSSEGTGNCQT